MGLNEDCGLSDFLLSRRGLLVAGGLAGSLVSSCTSLGSGGGGDAAQTPLETTNADLARVEWDILRTFTIGQVVINERVDHFIAKPGGRSMHFPIVGLFVVKDSKIELWRDYSLPGGKNRMEIEKA